MSTSTNEHSGSANYVIFLCFLLFYNFDNEYDLYDLIIKLILKYI